MTRLFMPLIVLSIGGLFGIAYATQTFNEPVFFLEPVKVKDTTFTVQRDDNRAAITVQSNGSDSAINLFDINDNQNYQFLLENNGNSLAIKDITNARNNIYIKTSNGFVGINDITPSEQLDVNGNIHLSKLNPKITANGDLCLGSGC